MKTVQRAEPYTGDIMQQCFLQPFEFKLHVAERKGNPRFMRERDYQRYLKEHQKRELRRTFVPVPNPEGAHFKLQELLAKQWSWFMLPNNCASFGEDVVQAGGSNAGLYFNCPSREQFK